MPTILQRNLQFFRECRAVVVVDIAVFDVNVVLAFYLVYVAVVRARLVSLPRGDAGVDRFELRCRSRRFQ